MHKQLLSKTLTHLTNHTVLNKKSDVPPTDTAWPWLAIQVAMDHDWL